MDLKNKRLNEKKAQNEIDSIYQPCTKQCYPFFKAGYTCTQKYERWNKNALNRLKRTSMLKEEKLRLEVKDRGEKQQTKPHQTRTLPQVTDDCGS